MTLFFVDQVGASLVLQNWQVNFSTCSLLSCLFLWTPGFMVFCLYSICGVCSCLKNGENKIISVVIAKNCCFCLSFCCVADFVVTWNNSKSVWNSCTVFAVGWVLPQPPKLVARKLYIYALENMLLGLFVWFLLSRVVSSFFLCWQLNLVSASIWNLGWLIVNKHYMQCGTSTCYLVYWSIFCFIAF